MRQCGLPVSHKRQFLDELAEDVISDIVAYDISQTILRRFAGSLFGESE